MTYRSKLFLKNYAKIKKSYYICNYLCLQKQEHHEITEKKFTANNNNNNNLIQQNNG